MIIFKQAKRDRISQFWLLIIFLTASCNSVEQSEVNLPKIPPIPPSGQPVEYGASLSEWEETTQADLEQIESNNGVNTGLEQPWEPVPTVTLPVSTPELVITAASTETGGTSADSPSVSPVLREITFDAGTEIGVNSTDSPEQTGADAVFIFEGVSYQEILWDALIPADFTVDAIFARYEEQLVQFEDGSSEGYDLYTQMQAEFNKAPVNELMDGTLVRLPGFIAPLEYTEDLITEFLLVPYFGACIHVPAPPANQTVLVKMSEGQGIKFEDAYYPFWVMGELTAESAMTNLAQAGYYIENALIELYSDGS